MKGKRERSHVRLSLYFYWPLFFWIGMILCQVLVFVADRRSGLLMLPFTAAGSVCCLLLLLYARRRIRSDLLDFAVNYTQVQKALLHDLALPYGVLDTSGQILWSNGAMKEVFAEEKRKDVLQMMPELAKLGLPQTEAEGVRMTTVTYRDRIFRTEMNRIPLPEDFSGIGVGGEGGDGLIALYMFDETDLEGIRQEMEGGRMVAGYLYIDNFDDLMQSVEEVRRSLLAALIDRKINRYFGQAQGIVKALERDRYLFAIEQRHLAELRADKFSLLEDVKTVSIGNDMTVTLSIGMGTGGESFAQNFEYAQIAIDMALGRGGDQAVLKEKDNISYFGGKSLSVEKNTRVKARAKAQALRELMMGCENVIAMGHRLSDIDSLGAAAGVYRAAVTMGKKAHIVLNDVISSIRPMKERFSVEDGYPEDLFLTSAQALERADKEKTLVVVVDVNRPQLTECPELLSKVERVVLLDHHRQSSDSIEGAVLSYVEPYASSACELIAEVLQYIGDGVKIRPPEADALFAGIMVDTNNFLNKTGVRTFEAAAFLRRSGADITRVRKLFRDTLEEHKARADVVRSAEIFEGAYAIGVNDAPGLESPTVIGAQAANELLDIVGVKASFVLTPFQDQIFVSARSIDEVNVQLVMERLGGGGHLSIAGAQLPFTLEETREALKQTLHKMQEEGELT